MKKIKVKSCPFCGSSPAIYCTGGNPPEEWWVVDCLEGFRLGLHQTVQVGRFGTEADAITAWNERLGEKP